jgi:hypothetical protein
MAIPSADKLKKVFDSGHTQGTDNTLVINNCFHPHIDKVIISAGVANRLSSIIYFCPKVMIPVDYVIKVMQNDFGSSGNVIDNGITFFGRSFQFYSPDFCHL